MTLGASLFAEPALIAVAPTGARRTKMDHSALPISPAEIAETAVACRDAGATLLHLHVRDADGQHTLDVQAYRDAIEAVRRAIGDDLIIQITTEAVGRYGVPAQMETVRALEPEAVSLAIGEIVPSEAEEGDAAGFLEWLTARRIVPQYILYSGEDIRRFADLCERGIIPIRARNILFVLGRYAAEHNSRPLDLLEFLRVLQDVGTEVGSWSLCAFDRGETACAVAGLAMGGHARVGFENNLYLADGKVAPSNAALVAAVAEGARVLGRQVADAAAARAILGTGIQ